MNYEATTSSSLKGHIKSQHQGLKKSCNQCEYQGSPEALRYHIKTKHDKIVKYYSCIHCEHKATKSSHLKSHVLAKHKTVSLS